MRLPSTSAHDQARDAGVDVHDRAAGEVERALWLPSQPLGSHIHVRDRAVDQQSSHRTMNHEHQAENFMRSANAPAISAGVMIANVIWNIM